MATSGSMHSSKGWTAWFKQSGITIWVTVEDGEGNDVAFFFNDVDQAERVASAFNYRATTEEKTDE